MLITRKKTRWALYCPSALPPFLVLTLLVLLFPSVHIGKDSQHMLWLAFCGLLGGTILTARVACRLDDHVVVRDLLSTTSILITPSTRISAKLECSPHSARSEPSYSFRIVGPDDKMAELGKAWYVFGSPADMGRRLSSVLDIPLDDDAPGAGGGQPGGPVVKVETKAEPKGLEDRVTGWVRRHWLLSIGGSLALFLTYLHLAGGVEMRAPAQIDMPCAGHGYHARIRFGAFTRIDGDVSGQVNPGNSEISVWDNSRRCWARRIVSVELGHRQRVDCAWVLASSDCLTGDP
jgi:hypothetical protein